MGLASVPKLEEYQEAQLELGIQKADWKIESPSSRNSGLGAN